MTRPEDTDHPFPLLFSNKSHVGAVRDENEDYLGYFRVGDRHAFLVADGMGGAVAGALASRTAVEASQVALRARLSHAPGPALAAAVEAANAACLDIQHNHPEMEGLGTTLDLLLIEGSKGWWAHVGDGRIYLVRRARSVQLTRDHSVVQRMVDGGLLEPDDAVSHPHRHVLYKAIGRSAVVEPDLAPEPIDLVSGDSLVLCSDGLSDVVSAQEIGHVVGVMGPEQSCEQLVALALKRGGNDNVTVQVIHRGKPRRSWHYQSRVRQSPSETHLR